MPAKILNKSKTIKLWLPLLACMGLIFYASSIPGTDLPDLFPSQDIIFHFLTYLILGFFFARALKNSYANASVLKIILFTVVFGVAYGVSDELHQALIPNRTVSGFDVFVDGIGSFVGSLIYR